MTKPELFIGLISGTSVDGIDCVLVRFEDEQPVLVDAHFKPTSASIREQVLRLCEGHNISLELLGQTDVEIGRAFAEAVSELLDKTGLSASDITAIGSHGQTVWHQPGGEAPFTLQIGDPNSIAQLTGITTVADFRRRDLAAGGEGAPLAPLLHRNVLHSNEVDRVIINIGGFANITVLPRSGDCFAYDTGPGNVLMDYWIEKHQQQQFDRDGAWAAKGNFNLGLLDLLLQEDYFKKAPPKSTGRELFNGPWLEQKLTEYGGPIEPVDVQASLLTLTVHPRKFISAAAACTTRF
jgi:anhydro-N-acetylmuramic acid kinase